MRMKDLTVETVLDRVQSLDDDVSDAVVTRKGNRVTIAKIRGNYVKRRLIITVKEEKFDV